MNKRVGLIINPYAGLGGPAALKGSDGIETVKVALQLGIKPQSIERAHIALAELLARFSKVDFLTYGGPMGETLLKKMKLPHRVLAYPETPDFTSAQDTYEAARLMLHEQVDLLLFAGGDGTARDIARAVGEKLLVLGIPSGVKMHSAVYAMNPKMAGRAAAAFLSGSNPAIKLGEVMDIDEKLFRQGVVTARLFAYMKTPDNEAWVQSCKVGRSVRPENLEGLAAGIAEEMEPDVLYLIGPGSTTRALMQELNLSSTLLGVDLVCNKKLVLSDAREEQIWNMLKKYATDGSENSGAARIIVTIIGGQGNLFGRGNQQFSPRILRFIGRSHVIIVAEQSKLLGLNGRPLSLDTGDPSLDEVWSGSVRVRTAYREETIYRIA